MTESADLIDEGDWSGHGWDGSGIRMGVWAGGRFGFQYTTFLPGQSISMAQTMGREAGRWIAGH